LPNELNEKDALILEQNNKISKKKSHLKKLKLDFVLLDE
jgi:hypothetical protein